MYGYNIVNGRAVINEVEAANVRHLFSSYLDGKSIAKAGELIPHTTTTCGRMLEDKTFLGTSFYPPIIDEEIFRLVQEKRVERYDPRKRGRRNQRIAPQPVISDFEFSGRPRVKGVEPLQILMEAYSLLVPATPAAAPDIKITVTTNYQSTHAASHEEV